MTSIDFDRLYRDESRALRARARRVSGDVALADDLLQETFLRAWASRDTLADPRKARGWLHAILRNAAASSFRRRREAPLGDDRVPVVEVAGAEGAVFLRQVLRALPPEQARALLLVALLGHDHRSAAEIEGCSAAAMRARLHRARKSVHRMGG
ncbi:MAG: RNA polymerase sigma factor [Rubricella sp.]